MIDLELSLSPARSTGKRLFHTGIPRGPKALRTWFTVFDWPVRASIVGVRTVLTGTPPFSRGLGKVEFFLGTPPFQVLARSPERPGIRMYGEIMKRRIRANIVSSGLKFKATAATA